VSVLVPPSRVLSPEELRQFATEQLARINAAYEKLTRMISGDHLSGRGDELIDLAESNLFR